MLVLPGTNMGMPTGRFSSWEYDRRRIEELAREVATTQDIAEARSRSIVFAINLSHQVYFPEERHVPKSGTGDLGISDARYFDERSAYLDF